MKFDLQQIGIHINGIVIDYRMVDDKNNLIQRTQNKEITSRKITDIIYECKKRIEQEMLNEYICETSKNSCEQGEIERN